MNTGIFNPESSVSLLKSFLNIKYGGDWVEKFGYQQLYLNHDLVAKKRLTYVICRPRLLGF